MVIEEEMSRGLDVLKGPNTWKWVGRSRQRREPSAKTSGEQKTRGQINTKEVVELEVGDHDLKVSFWWYHLTFRGHQPLPFAYCL